MNKAALLEPSKAFGAFVEIKTVHGVGAEAIGVPDLDDGVFAVIRGCVWR